MTGCGMMEQLVLLEGEILGIRDRISPQGDELVELHVMHGTAHARCLAYAQRGAEIRRLVGKLADLARRKGMPGVAGLRVRVEVSGIVRSRDLIVTGFRVAPASV